MFVIAFGLVLGALLVLALPFLLRFVWWLFKAGVVVLCLILAIGATIWISHKPVAAPAVKATETLERVASDQIAQANVAVRTAHTKVKQAVKQARK